MMEMVLNNKINSDIAFGIQCINMFTVKLADVFDSYSLGLIENQRPGSRTYSEDRPFAAPYRARVHHGVASCLPIAWPPCNGKERSTGP